MPLIESIAAQAAGMGLGTIYGLALEKHQDQRQLRQQDRLLYQQQGYNKEMTEWNRMQQMKLWEDTNYKAQMEQLRKAGLNPGLIYGMSGGGGATTNIAQGNVTGAHAPQGGGEIMGGIGMGIQSAMAAAQIENIKAQTEKTKVDTAKTAGVDTELTKTQTASLAQGITNLKAQETLTRVQTEIAQVEASVSRQTINEQMKAWENIAEKGTQEIRGLQIANDLSEDQYNDKIKDLKSQIAERSIRMALMNAQTSNVNQDTKNKIQEILESDTRIKTMAGHLQLQWAKMDREGAQDHSEGANDDWNFIKDFVPGMLIPIGRGFNKSHTPIKGFR